MPELGGRWLRIAFGLTLLALALVQLRQFAESVQGQGQLRRSVIGRVEAPLRAAQPQLGAMLAYGAPTGWSQAVDLAHSTHPDGEAELFDRDGRRLASRPAPAPVEHRPDEQQRKLLVPGALLTIGPVAGASPRMLSYLAFRSGGRDVLLRVAVPAPELVEDLRERRRTLLGHAFMLLALVVAAVLILSPDRQPPREAPPRALGAYVEAMSRLREHGQAETERYRAERQRLEERIRDAEPMARAGELTSGIVHEVRNGLATILGWTRFIEGRLQDEEALDAARRIRDECETLEAVVRRFVEFVKDEELRLAPLDVARMLARVVAREASARAGAEVMLNAGEGLTLVADEEMLERAFENLVRNAREAAGAGGHVWVQGRGDGEQVSVTVADDGPGLTPEQREALRPFRTTKAGGLGLGLPIAIKMIRLHGGELTLATRPPRGLLVTVRLPREPLASSSVRYDA